VSFSVIEHSVSVAVFYKVRHETIPIREPYGIVYFLEAGLEIPDCFGIEILSFLYIIERGELFIEVGHVTNGRVKGFRFQKSNGTGRILRLGAIAEC
jgi:hypothetical protein